MSNFCPGDCLGLQGRAHVAKNNTRGFGFIDKHAGRVPKTKGLFLGVTMLRILDYGAGCKVRGPTVGNNPKP